jgi:hypothetical protein
MEEKTKRKFKEEDKIKCLLWCDRHCCLCRKNCGLDIEIAHIDRSLIGEEVNDIDNAIPLCYECHAKTGHYNSEEPRGNKYKPKELKARREQIYEEFTRHLVPSIDFQVTQMLVGGRVREFPDVGFAMRHLGRTLPVKVLLSLNIYRDGGMAYSPGGHYAKEEYWKMNPGLYVQGHFEIPEVVFKNAHTLSAVMNDIEIIDEYNRHHQLLPMKWEYEIEGGKNWWYNP